MKDKSLKPGFVPFRSKTEILAVAKIGTIPKKGMGIIMFKIEAIVREEVLYDVRQALSDIEVKGITVYQVMGCGVQKGWSEMVRGKKIELNMLPKMKLEIVVSTKEWVSKTIDVIKSTAYTGNIGDGKIFVHELSEVVRIRTDESGVAAIN